MMLALKNQFKIVQLRFYENSLVFCKHCIMSMLFIIHRNHFIIIIIIIIITNDKDLKKHSIHVYCCFVSP